MSCLNPFGDTNSRRCENVRPTTFQPLTLPYLRATAAVLVDGPDDIMMRQENGSADLAFERVFRLVVRTPNRRLESWAVYRREREWEQRPEDDGGSILRHCSWDTMSDLDQRSWERGEGPDVTMNSRYVSAQATAPLRPLFEALDREIQAGIHLHPRPRSEYPAWQELGIWRALDWGLVDVTWLVVQQSAPAEKAALDLAMGIDQVLEESKREAVEVATFRMVYAWTPYLVLS